MPYLVVIRRGGRIRIEGCDNTCNAVSAFAREHDCAELSGRFARRADATGPRPRPGPADPSPIPRAESSRSVCSLLRQTLQDLALDGRIVGLSGPLQQGLTDGRHQGAMNRQPIQDKPAIGLVSGQ
jgi:hypothetical protein